MPTRTCRNVPLTKQPLVLVLCQVSFSPIPTLADSLPLIQEDFRRASFPIDRSGTMHRFLFTPGGPQTEVVPRFELRDRAETSSVVVLKDSVILQTTAYAGFERFAERLVMALKSVFTRTEHERFGVVQRIGLRYVNVIVPPEGDDHRTYLRPGLHGLSSDVFLPGRQLLHLENAGQTKVDEGEGTLVVRISQDESGACLPADLQGGTPRYVPPTASGKLVTFADFDHAIQGSFDPDVDWIEARLYTLHDHIIETFHQHVVTEKAIERWR